MIENNHNTKKFEEALQLLNDAAKDKKEEIQNLINDRYTQIRDVLGDATKKSRRDFKRAKQTAEEWVGEGEETIREAASELDDRVHENPWAYLGGVAAGALLLGFILGSSSRNK